jgi:hypothetical protein
MVSSFIGFSAGLVILMLLSFGLLQWFHVPAGDFIDWIIGTASFWWLIVIVTVPWNIHFGAKNVLANAAESEKKGIRVDAQQVDYVRVVAKRSLWMAIALHILSALGLYVLAATGISAIGYIGSGAALLFTALRPAIAFYQYLYTRLREIGQSCRYPREDILELRDRVEGLESRTKELRDRLNPEFADSFAATQQRSLDALRRDLSRLSTAHEDLKATNQSEHDRLSREAKTAIAQLSTDGQFLEHVREIIRFFKAA